jgi:anaerobic selenocysteine-containing dehydrogenase
MANDDDEFLNPGRLKWKPSYDASEAQGQDPSIAGRVFGKLKGRVKKSLRKSIEGRGGGFLNRLRKDGKHDTKGTSGWRDRYEIKTVDRDVHDRAGQTMATGLDGRDRAHVPRAERVADAPNIRRRDRWNRETDAPVPESIAMLTSTAGLPDLESTPAYLLPEGHEPHHGRLSCAYCGVGDSGVVRGAPQTAPESAPVVEIDGGVGLHRKAGAAGGRRSTAGRVGKRAPTKGCAKLQSSTGHEGTLFPIHLVPSIKERHDSARRPTTYARAISRFADLILDHRDPDTQILVYGCGQIDYFTIFAFQEVFRLLGARNIAGNAEHCLNAGAVHNEFLTGQEGPFLTFDNAFLGPGRFYILNGWNGLVTHPGAYWALMRRKDFDGYVIEVMESETVQDVARRLGEDRILYIKASADPLIALAVAHEILRNHPDAVDRRFLNLYGGKESWESFRSLAAGDQFDAAVVARRAAPEERYVERLERGIRAIAAKLADPEIVPINIPSVGLSQTSGSVAHCLWGSLLAMLGKFGLRPGGKTAGGTLRIPGQINAETEVQGLSSQFFFGRIRVDTAGTAEAATRMGLPTDAYHLMMRDDARVVLDYSDPSTRVDRELIIAFGTHFSANMMGRDRWIEKLTSPDTQIVVIDPIPDPFAVEHARLIIPSPPHAAAGKVYQNGEWRLSLSTPRKKAAPETRTDATIVYDLMAEITRRVREDAMVRMVNPDLATHLMSGYLADRYERPEDGGGLPRVDGEVSRPFLWKRILDYMDDGPGRGGVLYCRPEHPDGTPIEWEDLLTAGHIVYGGVGTHRFTLDYDDPTHVPFRDIHRKPRKFEFFTPTAGDLAIPDGTILNSGRSGLSDDPRRIKFAVDTFNSGKHTPATGLPAENPLHVSPALASEVGLVDGGRVKVTNVETRHSIVLPVRVTPRVKGRGTYVSFHKSKADLELQRYVNTVTSHAGRCPYTSQTNFKKTRIELEPA